MVDQRWEQERVERAYQLHKARHVSDAALMRRLFPQQQAAPGYQASRRREQAGLPPVSVQVVGEEEEEVCAVLRWVVGDLASELYVELTHGLLPLTPTPHC